MQGSHRAITSEGLAQGPYVAARAGVESATFRTKGSDNHHLTNHAPAYTVLVQCTSDATSKWAIYDLAKSNVLLTTKTSLRTQSKKKSDEKQSETKSSGAQKYLPHCPRLLILCARRC